MKLKNKNIVVTGAGSGIGKACAVKLSGEGASVIVADIDGRSAEQTWGEIKRSGGKGMWIQTDVSDENAVQNLLSFAESNLGTIHGLVNNAAIQVNRTVEHTRYEEWNRQMAVNVGGVFLCSKYFLPLLRKSRGAIVNMSSVNGFFVEAACAGYCASKAAIIGLTKAMAIDHGADGIRINAVCPGYIDAGLAAGYFESQPDPVSARLNAGKLHALGRIGRAEEVAGVVCFLLSDESSFVTGSIMVVDGGFGSGIPPVAD